MGNCETCYKKHELHINDHPLSIDNDSPEQHNYLSFNDKHELNSAVVINKFVSRCLLNKLLRVNHNELKNKVSNLIKQTRYAHRTQEYYKHKLSQVLALALHNKNVFGFNKEYFNAYLSNLSALKEKIKASYVRYISESEVHFKQTLFAYMTQYEHNKHSNFSEFNTLIEKDIDNMFNLCLTVPSAVCHSESEEEANKSNLTESVIYNNTELSNELVGSCLLNIFASSKDTVKFGFDKKLKCFIRKYYYQYVIKQLNCVSHLHDYMQFSYEDIRSTLTDTNYTYIDYDSALYHRLQDTINSNSQMRIQQKKTCQQELQEQQVSNSDRNEYKKIKSHKTHHVDSKRQKYKAYKSRNTQSNINSHATNGSTNYRYINSLFSGKSTQMASSEDNTTNLKTQRTSMPHKAFPPSHPLPNKVHTYKGGYDKDLCLYSGHGVLYKRYSNAIYEGTFRYGKKSGIGIKYKELSDRKYKCICGEWERNKLNGFGYYLYINHMNIEIKEGYYTDGKLRSGSHIMLNEINETLVEVTKYEGTFNENEQYEGSGSLIKETYVLNKRHCTWVRMISIQFHILLKVNVMEFLMEYMIMDAYSQQIL